MKKVYVNEDWCLGCHLCEYYCAFANSEGEDMARTLKNCTIRPRIEVEGQNGVYFAVACRHCEEPLCMKACLTGALTQVNGAIVVDQDKCISCYTCIACCPYGTITPAASGVIQKCELCGSQTAAPKCVQGCPNGAIVFEEREIG
jgi:carbon-monoxide dehydrogenase iron sulfur subunit